MLTGAALGTSLAVLGAVGALGVVLVISLRFGSSISRLVFSPDDEVLLLVFGLALLVAGIAGRLQTSSRGGGIPAWHRALARLTSTPVTDDLKGQPLRDRGTRPPGMAAGTTPRPEPENGHRADTSGHQTSLKKDRG